MTTVNIKKSEAAELLEKGYVAVVYVAYGDNEGNIISKHKSSSAAQKAARASDSYGVRYLDELTAH